MHRAAHQILEDGRIFTDPLALRILGVDAETVVRRAERDPTSHRMRLFIAVRTRFAEDTLAAAMDHGVRQVVVLGAGLDTYAYRTPPREGLRIFEVDHPATQAWKRQLLADAAIPLPESLTFTPVDFERQTLSQGLQAAGFQASQPAFFTWLGVVPYLTEEAVWSTLGFLVSLPAGAHVVFDYSDPPDSLPPELRDAHDRRAAHVSMLAEPWVRYFEPEDLHSRLLALGFSAVEDLGPAEILERYLPRWSGSPRTRGGHILHAWHGPQDACDTQAKIAVDE